LASSIQTLVLVVYRPFSIGIGKDELEDQARNRTGEEWDAVRVPPGMKRENATTVEVSFDHRHP
jgi:hypothetical protein